MNALAKNLKSSDALETSDFETEGDVAEPERFLTGDSIVRLHEEDRTENLYHSCCGGSSDKRLVVLLTQVSVGILVLSFSGAMLAVSDEPNDKAIYMSLISSTLSYWLGKNEHSRE